MTEVAPGRAPGAPREGGGSGPGRDAERRRQAEEEVAGVHAVGRDDARRVEPAPVLALGVEADQLGRAGEEAEDARHLQELLEVEDGIVAAGPERLHQAS